MRLLILSIAMLVVGASGCRDAQRPAGYPPSYETLIASAREEGKVRVYGATDRAAVQPAISGFEAAYPGISVDYEDLQSRAVYDRVVRESDTGQPGADLVLSSGMALQTKLINDGYAQAYRSPEKPALPTTAVWKDMGYGLTSEPIVFVVNRQLVPAEQVPQTHDAFEQLLVDRRQDFMGKVTTYDPAKADAGYLYLTEDYAITRDTRSLIEAIADTRPMLSSTSAEMLDAVAEGRAAIAYNVLGSYALARAKRDERIQVVFPSDYTITASRVAFIARDARHPAAAQLFLDFLLSRSGQMLLAQQGLSPVRSDISNRMPSREQQRPIRIGPQLLIHLDSIKRQRFLAEWRALLAEGSNPS
ncbi:ABC transporter substrate-binding protein [Qipengyuania flava]|nr:ABC transporter substrate-binding protein [Qipengyuania flava]